MVGREQGRRSEEEAFERWKKEGGGEEMVVAAVETCSRLIKKPFVWPLLDRFANDHTRTRKIRVVVQLDSVQFSSGEQPFKFDLFH